MVPPKTEQSKLLLVNWSYDWDDQRFDDIRCELTGYPGWCIRPDVVVTDEGLALRSLLIEPTDGVMPAGGIPTRMLRQLRTGDLIASLRAARRQASVFVGSWPTDSVTTRVGRRGRDDLHYARLAAGYVAALDGTHPVAVLAAEHNLSPSQVRNLIHAARRRGMLTDAPPGRAGGELTEKAVRLLRGER